MILTNNHNMGHQHHAKSRMASQNLQPQICCIQDWIQSEQHLALKLPIPLDAVLSAMNKILGMKWIRMENYENNSKGTLEASKVAQKDNCP